MRFNDAFYYTEKQEGKIYGSAAPGKISIDRLLQSKPDYWEKPSLEKLQKPKSLILADWTAKNWFSDKIDAVIARMEQLIEEGFTIYIWQDGVIEPLTKEKLSSLHREDIREKMTPELSSVITLAASQQQEINKEHIHVLDDYWVDQCLGPDPTTTPPRRVYVSSFNTRIYIDYFRHLSRKVEFTKSNKIISILQNVTPPVEEIAFDEYSRASILALSDFEKIFPEAKIHLQCNALSLDKRDLENFLSGKKINYLHGLDIPNDEIALLERIELNGPITDEQFAQLLEKAPHLKHLEIGQGDFLELKKRPPTSSIEIITGSLPNKPNDSYENLLLSTPNLRILEIIDEISNLIIKNELNLPNLYELSITGCIFSAATIHNILSKVNNLHVLDLMDCKLDESWALGLNLSSLVTLKATEIDHKSLQAILTSASQLQHLEFRKLPKDFALSPYNLSALRSFTLNHEIRTLDLHAFIAKSPLLKSLRLAYCVGLNTPCENDFDFPSLELLDLNGSDITAKNLQLMLAKSPHLVTLNLSSCKLTEKMDKSLALPSLEELILKDAQITPNNLKMLLANAPSLKVLHLDRVQNIPWDDLDLSSLKILHISRDSSDKLIASLQERWPNLSIELSGVRHIEPRQPAITKQAPKSQSEIPEELKQLLDSIPLTEEPLETTQHLETAPTETVEHEPTAQPATVAYDPTQHLRYRPPAENAPFQYQGLNKTIAQWAIIEQLSQYLTLTNQHLDCIPKLKGGICNALAELFKDISFDKTVKDKMTLEQWNYMLANIVSWNGSAETLDKGNLIEQFELIWKYVDKFYFANKKSEETTFLGDHLLSFLKEHPQDFVLGNNWHDIAVKYSKEDDQWVLYDPNSSARPERVGWEELADRVKHSLGNLIAVRGDFDVQIDIKDGQSFLQEGGLLTLTRINYGQVKSIMSLLPKPEEVSDEALDGLFMRNLQGAPAWVCAMLNSTTCQYTVDLLQQFVKRNPKTFAQQLKKSVEALSANNRELLVIALVGGVIDAERIGFVEELRSIFHLSSSHNYAYRLETWRKEKPVFNSIKKYCQHIVQPEIIKKRLIEFQSTDDLHAMALSLNAHCQAIKRPIFVVNSPDDLVCSAPFVKKVGDKGQICRGPGGPLHDFLQAHQDEANPPVILINYDNFEADDIVRFNAILDKKRSADGSLLPECALVVGLINTQKPSCYQGADFYSRFDAVGDNPFSSETLGQAIGPLPVTEKGEDLLETTVIDFYHGQDWEERLLGRWVIKDNGLFFEEGELIKAIDKGLPITLQNGLWENRKFETFWRQAFLLGHIKQGDKIIPLPPELKFFKASGYDWKSLKDNVRIQTGFQADASVLNPSRLMTFFSDYSYNNITQSISTLPGLLEANQGTELHVNLTRELNEDEWGMLLKACHERKVQLVVHRLPFMNLPQDLQAALSENPVDNTSPALERFDDKTILPTHIFQTNDVDATTSYLSQAGEWMVIDVSECEAPDLLIRLKGKLDKEALDFKFTQTQSALLKGLSEGKNIILKGKFSKTLGDELAPLLLERQNNPHMKGKLLLVSNDTTPLSYCSQVTEFIVDSVLKKTLLTQAGFEPKDIESLDSRLSKESLSQLKARLTYQKNNPALMMDQDPWQGMKYLPKTKIEGTFNADKSKEITDAFNQNRLDSVNEILSRQPYVYLSGQTAVGKSTFVEKYLKTDEAARRTLYQGEKKLLEWAKDTRPGVRKILFLDEANLSPKQWSEFEGLFDSPPGILIKGTYYPLTEEHKVIFAGNPLSYGDARRLAPFFEKHGNSVVFTALPQELIYEEILKPVFSGTALEGKEKEICLPLLNIYQFICEISEDEILISPRELQMMALMILNYQQKNPAGNISLAAEHYAYELAKPLVPQNHQKRLELFKPQTPPIMEGTQEKKGSFLFTESRQPARCQMDDLIFLREIKRSGFVTSDAQKYGGLGGMVLEGDPGTGKSELVVENLVAQGYKEIHDYQSPFDPTLNTDKVFYRMPVSMQIPEKEKLLLKAFNEGAIVLIDEINSSPMMERLLNALLMGRGPDGSRPIQPGFLVIGTQNSAAKMAGRQEASTALKRRIITTKIPAYTMEEMHEILISKGISREKAILMVNAYTKNVERAEKENLSPAPTFRDLMKVADEEIKIKSKSKELQEPLIEKSVVDYEPFSFFKKEKKKIESEFAPSQKKVRP